MELAASDEDSGRRWLKDVTLTGLDELKSPSQLASIVPEYFPKRAAPLHLAR